MFSFEYLVSYLSTFYHLKAGDIIATGTPNGAGARLILKISSAGDVVEVEVSGIGSLKGVITEEIRS